MKPFKKGTKVIWNTGFWGQDHGKRCWWAQTKKAVVVDFKNNDYLIELENGERHWANANAIKKPS
jgi:hypothetical protein